jgi:hypothetical protein
MANAPAQIGDTVQYVDQDGKTYNVTVENAQPPPPPSAPGATPNPAGGTLAADTYEYVLTYRVNGVESGPSAQASATTTGATSQVQLSWSPIAGATDYRIYGRQAGTLGLLYTGATPSFNDTGSVTPGAAPPTNTGHASLRFRGGGGVNATKNTLLTNVPMETAVGQTNVYRKPQTGPAIPRPA